LSLIDDTQLRAVSHLFCPVLKGKPIWGHPDEKRIRKACGRAQDVIIYTYQHRSSQVWWEQQQKKLHRFQNLSVHHIDEVSAQALNQMAARSMQLQCTIQDGQCWFSNGEKAIEITPHLWKEAQNFGEQR